jgi:hypothetical protein
VRIRWELAGAHWVAEDEQAPLALTLEGRRSGLGLVVQGTMRAPQIDDGPLSGNGRVSVERGALRYALHFEGVETGRWTFRAHQSLSPWGSPLPFTLVTGSLEPDQGTAPHRLRLRLDPRSDLPRALWSLQLGH